jgi:hypothetical protein
MQLTAYGSPTKSVQGSMHPPRSSRSEQAADRLSSTTQVDAAQLTAVFRLHLSHCRLRHGDGRIVRCTRGVRVVG